MFRAVQFGENLAQSERKDRPRFSSQKVWIRRKHLQPSEPEAHDVHSTELGTGS